MKIKRVQPRTRKLVVMSGFAAQTRLNAKNQKIIKPIKGKAYLP